MRTCRIGSAAVVFCLVAVQMIAASEGPCDGAAVSGIAVSPARAALVISKEHTPQDGLTEAEKEHMATLRNTVQEVLRSLPAPIWQTIAAGGVEVQIARRMKDVKPDVSEESKQSAKGLFIADQHRLIVAGETANGVQRKPGEIAATTRHELGHAFDFACGEVSAGPHFMAAYRCDVNRYKNTYKKEVEAKWVASDSANPSEAFAAAFDNSFVDYGPYTRTSNAACFQKHFPCVSAFMTSWLRTVLDPRRATISYVPPPHLQPHLGTAVLHVDVPDEARVLINGRPTSLTNVGRYRHYRVDGLCSCGSPDTKVKVIRRDPSGSWTETSPYVAEKPVPLRAGEEVMLRFVERDFKKQPAEEKASTDSAPRTAVPSAAQAPGNPPPPPKPEVTAPPAGCETPLGKIAVDPVALRAVVTTDTAGKPVTFAFEKEVTQPKLRLVHDFQPPRALVPVDALFSAVVNKVQDGKPTRLFALETPIAVKFTDIDDQSRLGYVPLMDGDGNLQKQLHDHVAKLPDVGAVQLDCYVRFGSSYMIKVSGTVTIRVEQKPK